jgi:hypothetical protein
MWSFDQGKSALILVQKWPYWNKVIDLRKKKFQKITTSW